jgi:hypothetical protein
MCALALRSSALALFETYARACRDIPDRELGTQRNVWPFGRDEAQPSLRGGATKSLNVSIGYKIDGRNIPTGPSSRGRAGADPVDR